MDYYINAQETERAAIALLEAGIYRQSVFMSCLAVELFLKSKLQIVSHDDALERSHDIVNMYKALRTRFEPKRSFDKVITKCRKYFNESRYPYSSDVSIYTKDFAMEFISYVADIRDFIDNDCLATLEDLKKRFPGE